MLVVGTADATGVTAADTMVGGVSSSFLLVVVVAVVVADTVVDLDAATDVLVVVGD